MPPLVQVAESRRQILGVGVRVSLSTPGSHAPGQEEVRARGEVGTCQRAQVEEDEASGNRCPGVKPAPGPEPAA